MRTYGTNNILPVYGNYKPVERRINNTKIAGWIPSTKQGESVSFTNTYNDTADVVIEGNTVQEQSIWGTNLVTNGDFSNGLTGWSSKNVTGFDVVDGIAEFTANALINGISITTSRIAGRKYYLFAKLKSNTNKLCIASKYELPLVYHSGSGDWKRISCVYTALSDAPSWIVSITDYTSTGWSQKYVDYLGVLDLTTIFGAGNEPTTAQMDAMLSQYPNSWFDGKGQLTKDIATYTANSPSPEYPADIKSTVGNLLVNGNVVAPIPELLNIGGVADTYNPVTGELLRKIDPDIDNCTTQSIAEVGGAYVLGTPVPIQLTPVVIPTYPRTTVIEQDGEVKGNIIATVKVVDDMGV